MLEIQHVYKTFNPGTVNEKRALNNLCFTLEEGQFVTVIGGNGAGKSTMLNAVAGVFPVDEGRIVIDGVDVTRLPEHRRARYIGRVRKTWPWLCAGGSGAPSAPESPGPSATNTAACWPSWIWGWRTASRPRWGCSPAASARR